MYAQTYLPRRSRQEYARPIKWEPRAASWRGAPEDGAKLAEDRRRGKWRIIVADSIREVRKLRYFLKFYHPSETLAIVFGEFITFLFILRSISRCINDRFVVITLLSSCADIELTPRHAACVCGNLIYFEIIRWRYSISSLILEWYARCNNPRSEIFPY